MPDRSGLPPEELWGSALGVAATKLITDLADTMGHVAVEVLGQRMSGLLEQWYEDFDDDRFREAFEKAMNRSIEIEEMDLLRQQVEGMDDT